jgi:hypothetical protein
MGEAVDPEGANYRPIDRTCSNRLEISSMRARRLSYASASPGDIFRYEHFCRAFYCSRVNAECSVNSSDSLTECVWVLDISI